MFTKKAQSGLPSVGSPMAVAPTPFPTKALTTSLVTGKSGGNKSTKTKKHSDGKGHQRITTTKM